jgi:uncharacterized protein YbjT (DUF2867 family)
LFAILVVLMGSTLVVGATGQLGLAVVKKLLANGTPVRAMVRNTESAERLRGVGAEPILADLTDPASLVAACSGVSVVVATANAAIPTKASDTFEAVERDGYRNLIRASLESGVSRFVYTSVPLSKRATCPPLVRYKRETEKAIIESGLNHVIFRAGIFMDVAFTMMGSMLPVRGSDAATVRRPFPFVASHLARIQDSIEKKGVAMIPGDGRTRHSFICVDDLANLLSAAASGGPSGVHEAGGPEALTYLDIVGLYEKILGVKLRVKKTPAWVFRLISLGLGPFSSAGANLMLLNYMSAIDDSVVVSASETAAKLGVRLTTAESFLQMQYARHLD